MGLDIGPRPEASKEEIDEWYLKNKKLSKLQAYRLYFLAKKLPYNIDIVWHEEATIWNLIKCFFGYHMIVERQTSKKQETTTKSCYYCYTKELSPRCVDSYYTNIFCIRIILYIACKCLGIHTWQHTVVDNGKPSSKCTNCFLLVERQ